MAPPGDSGGGPTGFNGDWRCANSDHLHVHWTPAWRDGPACATRLPAQALASVDAGAGQSAHLHRPGLLRLGSRWWWWWTTPTGSSCCCRRWTCWATPGCRQSAQPPQRGRWNNGRPTWSCWACRHARSSRRAGTACTPLAPRRGRGAAGQPGHRAAGAAGHGRADAGDPPRRGAAAALKKQRRTTSGTRRWPASGSAVGRAPTLPTPSARHLAAVSMVCQAARSRTTRFEQVRGAEQQPRNIDAGGIGPAKIDVTPFKALRCR